VNQHWAEFGRNVYQRFDYEDLDASSANRVIEHLNGIISGGPTVWAKYPFGESTQIVSADDFYYTDPVDSSITKNQGIRFLFSDGSRLIWRISGTGSVGATIRLYMEQVSLDAPGTNTVSLPPSTYDRLKAFADYALSVSRIQELTGRLSPTVIT